MSQLPGTNTVGLIKLINDGDRGALGRLLMRYEPYVRGILRKYGIDDTSQKAPEDYFQSIAIAVMAGLPRATLTDAGAFRAFLAGVAVNRILKARAYENRACRSGTVHDQGVPGVPSFLETLPSRDPAPDEVVEVRSNVERLREEIANQIPNGGDIFDDFLNEIPTAESAERIGVPLRTVQRRREMMTQYLRERLGDDRAAPAAEEPS